MRSGSNGEPMDSKKERPILFNSEMVRAILEGRKTQTRRIAKIYDPKEYPNLKGVEVVNFRKKSYFWNCHKSHPDHISNACPHGIFGDRLWVRETWDFLPNSNPREPGKPLFGDIIYWADGEIKSYQVPDSFNPMLYGCERRRPSIYMPRWASRINLEVIGIRVEQLNVVSVVDAIAEGVEYQGTEEFGRVFKCYTSKYNGGDWYPEGKDQAPLFSYQSLWESINGIGSWDANPWVWVIEFRRLE